MALVVDTIQEYTIKKGTKSFWMCFNDFLVNNKI